MGPPVFFGLSFLFVVCAVLYDLLSRKRIHPAYIMGRCLHFFLRAAAAGSFRDGGVAYVRGLSHQVTASYSVERHNLPAIPLAVVRRQVSQAELPRVVPECCGLVWNTLRAQGIRGGRHVALYWDGSIRLECGVELQGPFIEQDGVVRSATPAGVVASVTHFGSSPGLAAAPRPSTDGARPPIAPVRSELGNLRPTRRPRRTTIRR